MHMLDIHSVQNNQYITTSTWMNTVGSFPSLYIISFDSPRNIQQQKDLICPFQLLFAGMTSVVEVEAQLWEWRLVEVSELDLSITHQPAAPPHWKWAGGWKTTKVQPNNLSLTQTENIFTWSSSHFALTRILSILVLPWQALRGRIYMNKPKNQEQLKPPQPECEQIINVQTEYILVYLHIYPSVLFCLEKE